MSTQSYPWFKFAHVDYLLDPMIASISLEAQGANIRLMAHAARQLPFGTLPLNENALFAISGSKSFKQWFKIFNELLTANLWRKSGSIEEGNVRLFCPLMIVESAPVVTQESKQDDEQSQDDISAKRSAAANARWALKREQDAKDNANGDFASCKTNANDMQNENLHDAKPMQNDANGNFAYANTMQMGGKGGDLDLDLKQDLELNQEVNTTTNVVSAPHTSERVKNKKSQSNFSANEMILSCETLSAEVANDFINYRKAKKAPLTSSAWKTMVSEIQHSGMTPDNALSETMSAGWVGVKAEWLINRNAKQSPNVIPMSSRPKLPSQMTEDERQELRRKNAAEAKKILFGDDDFIDGVASHV